MLRVSVIATSAPSAKILHRPTGSASVLSAATAAVAIAAQRRADRRRWINDRASAARSWPMGTQDDGTGDWRAGNDHGRGCDRLNS